VSIRSQPCVVHRYDGRACAGVMRLLQATRRDERLSDEYRRIPARRRAARRRWRSRQRYTRHDYFSPGSMRRGIAAMSRAAVQECVSKALRVAGLALEPRSAGPSCEQDRPPQRIPLLHETSRCIAELATRSCSGRLKGIFISGSCRGTVMRTTVIIPRAALRRFADRRFHATQQDRGDGRGSRQAPKIACCGAAPPARPF
jgi:hypothetical protein